MRTKAITLLLLLPALLLGACGRLNDDDDGPGSGGDTGATGGTGDVGIEHPTGSDELILRIATGGGFVPVEYNLRSVPGISLFGDGRLIVTGPMIEIYPQPALPNLQVSQLTEEAIQAILAAAEEAGLLGGDASYDYPCVTDLPTTVFTVNAGGATHTVSAYALGFEDGAMAGGCPDVDVDARTTLLDFSTKVGDLRGWLPEGSIGEEREYVPSEMRVYVTEYRGDPELEQQIVQWPLEGSLAHFGEKDPNLAGYRCGVVDGADLELLLPAAQASNELTPWASDGGEHGLIFRPLLPDEHGC
ncbi:MAG: hypothetical protein ACXWXQ_00645 [Actinomycetota bacterium]